MVILLLLLALAVTGCPKQPEPYTWAPHAETKPPPQWVPEERSPGGYQTVVPLNGGSPYPVYVYPH